MPIRWVICPVVKVTWTDPETGALLGGFRAPKVATLIDPARDKPYEHSSAIDTAEWCVSAVRGQDFSALDADKEIVNLLETDYAQTEDLLDQTPTALGWSTGKANSLKAVLASHGASVVGLAPDSPLGDWLDRLCEAVHPSFKARGHWKVASDGDSR